MKTYNVELKRLSYITLTVEADSIESAEDLAWREIEHNTPNSDDANWDLSSIEEVQL